MNRGAGAFLLSLFIAADVACALPPSGPWFVGVWSMTEDEDGTPEETIEFRTGGIFVTYGSRCRPATATYREVAGDIYVTYEIPGKGPVVMVFRPSKDHLKLTYTSPRTRNNAVYERLAKNPCK